MACLFLSLTVVEAREVVAWPCDSLVVTGMGFCRAPDLKGARLARSDQIRDDDSNGDFFAIFRAVGRDAQNSAFQALDFLGRLVTLEIEEWFTRLDWITVGLEPADEDAFVHIPSEPGNGYFTSHESDFTYSAIKSRMAWAMVSGLGTTAASRGGL